MSRSSALPCDYLKSRTRESRSEAGTRLFPAGSHEAGDGDGDHGSEGIDPDIDRRRVAATDDALMELVRDRVEDRERERPGPRRST